VIVHRSKGQYFGPEEPSDLSTDEPEVAEDWLHGLDPNDVAAAVFDLDRAQELGFDINDPSVMRTVVETTKRKIEEKRRDAPDLIEATKQAIAKGEPIEPESVVYYMRVGNRVKIGYTTNLAARISAVMPEEVLATEPGGPQLESVRHRQFADLREASEWFRMEGPLLAHLETLRGEPCVTS
jgi:hypothetical protein